MFGRGTEPIPNESLRKMAMQNAAGGAAFDLPEVLHSYSMMLKVGVQFAAVEMKVRADPNVDAAALAAFKAKYGGGSSMPARPAINPLALTKQRLKTNTGKKKARTPKPRVMTPQQKLMSELKDSLRKRRHSIAGSQDGEEEPSKKKQCVRVQSLKFDPSPNTPIGKMMQQ